MPHTKIYFSSRAQAIVKGTQCERHSLHSHDPHVQGLSPVPRRGYWDKPDKCLAKNRREADTKKITKAFCKLLDEDQKKKHGKTNNPIDETAIDEFQQGVETSLTLRSSTRRRWFKEGNGGEHNYWMWYNS
ncbi:hypothetical protein DFH08DRAFT_972924 [Mycena albidolilacea]|uniref:Uncharacterized protein n=1 Tax=Mycena albidolilacea TaxID=1033008 RepID=A0AAD6ZAG3_9AGAR|nr:hypothetical protein DFH08DRAFT_972924 [Mycena albidolilacea]